MEKHFIPFAIVHAGQYGDERYGKDCLHFTHYDLLEEAGARLVDFYRCGDPQGNPQNVNDIARDQEGQAISLCPKVK